MARAASTRARMSPPADHALSSRLADVNGDGRPDLVAHHPTLRDRRRAERARPAARSPRRFIYPSPYSLNPATELDDDGADEDFYSVPSVGDFNGDGQLDIAVADPSGAIQLLLQHLRPADRRSVGCGAGFRGSRLPRAQPLTYAVTVTNHGPTTAPAAIADRLR